MTLASVLQCLHQPVSWHRSVSPQRSFSKLKMRLSALQGLAQGLFELA